MRTEVGVWEIVNKYVFDNKHLFPSEVRFEQHHQAAYRKHFSPCFVTWTDLFASLLLFAVCHLADTSSKVAYSVKKEFMVQSVIRNVWLTSENSSVSWEGKLAVHSNLTAKCYIATAIHAMALCWLSTHFTNGTSRHLNSA